MFKLLILAATVSALFPPTLLFAPSLPGPPVYVPTAPAPLTLAQRVEGAGNPLRPVTRAPCASPFPWHKEGCPGPPLSLRFTPPAAPSPPHFASTRREGWNPPTPPPPHSLPRPMRASPICTREPYAKGQHARGRARAVRWSNKHNKQWGNTVTDVAAVQRATQAGAVYANGRAGVRRRVQGEAESHDGTPARAQRARVCEQDQTRSGQGACQEWKGCAPILYLRPVDQLRKKTCIVDQ